MATLADRFWAKVDRRGPDECWPWRPAAMGEGYGVMRVNGVLVYAHRLAWTLTYGPIPPRRCVLHHCDNRPCANPRHLFLGTRADNVADMMSKGRHRPAPLFGEANPAAKLTDEQRAEVVALGGTLTQRQLAVRFGVSQQAISRVLQCASQQRAA